MELTREEVIQLIKEPVDPVIAYNCKLQNDHKVHIQGTGFESVLKQIIGYETAEQFKQKKLITKPFTRPIFKKILNAQSRWKTAQGTSKYYKFKKDNEDIQADFRENILGQAWKGSGIEDFVKEFLSKAIYEEFNGFMVIEKGATFYDGNIKYENRGGIKTRIKSTDKVKPYICFYAAEDIYKFKINGKKVEYIAFKFKEETRKDSTGAEKKYTYYRVIDDNYDYIVRKEGGDPESVIIDPEYPAFQHNIGQPPVCPVSTLQHNIRNEKTKTSPIEEVIALLDYMLHQFGEHVATNILHAHPTYYEMGQTCNYTDPNTGYHCDKGKIFTNDAENAEIDCPECKGLGTYRNKDASTVLTFPAKDGEGKPFSVQNIAGYATFPTEALEYQQAAIDWMEKRILDSALGMGNISNKDTSLDKTATEIIQVNIKPLEDIISDIIDIVEYAEESLTDFIGRMYYGDTYLGCEIIYGRQLNLRDENVLIAELKKAKESGATKSYIKAISEELVYSRFSRSESDQARNILLLRLEPLQGYTFSEVDTSSSIPPKTKLLKQNFTDYIERFELENGNIVEYEPNTEYSAKVKKIKAILDGYVVETETAISDAEKAKIPAQTTFN
jgi:hypothetical protein